MFLPKIFLFLLVATMAPTARAVELLPLPIFRQATDYTCGVAALQSVLFYWQAYDDGESKLARKLKATAKEGTHPNMIVEVAKKYGLEAEKKERMTLAELKKMVQKGDTVILDIQAWRDDEALSWENTWEDGHYVVLAGIDEKNIYVMDPILGTGYGRIEHKEFLSRWHDYENENSTRRIYEQMGIVIRGKKSLSQYPSRIIAVE